MTKYLLFDSFINGRKIMLDGTEGIIDTIQREDGSGKCYNVCLRTGKQIKTYEGDALISISETRKTVFVQTID